MFNTVSGVDSRADEKSVEMQDMRKAPSAERAPLETNGAGPPAYQEELETKMAVRNSVQDMSAQRSQPSQQQSSVAGAGGLPTVAPIDALPSSIDNLNEQKRQSASVAGGAAAVNAEESNWLNLMEDAPTHEPGRKKTKAKKVDAGPVYQQL